MLLQSTAKDKGITLGIDYALHLASSFIGDPGRIRQILTNLIGNAVKFTAKGSVIVHVTGKPVQNGSCVAVRVVVEDTGIGIPDDMVDHVFGEFNQVESERNRQFDGTGLGLAITKELVELMGGQIWVTSDEGTGSRFGFDLELNTTQGADIRMPELHKNLRHVLVVGDGGFSRGDPLCHQLEVLGLKVTFRKNLQDTLSAIHQGVDLVILDHLETGCIAVEMAEDLRAAGHEQPIFLLSHSPATSLNDAKSAAIDLVGQRPYARSDLFEWLSKVKPPESTESPAISNQIVPKESGNKTAPAPQSKTSDWIGDDWEAGEPHELRQMRILAAEDNKTNRLVFGKMLKSLNIQLEFACDGEEAVALYESFAPDLIFMDISMPRMDGKQATREIRKRERDSMRHTPIIAMTAHAMAGDDQEILNAGLDQYMTKPMKKGEILAQIMKFCPEHAFQPVPSLPDQAAG